MVKIKKNFCEFEKSAFKPSREISILFSIAIIIFGIGSIIYSEKRINIENIFIIGLVVVSSIYFVFLVKSGKSKK